MRILDLALWHGGLGLSEFSGPKMAVGSYILPTGLPARAGKRVEISQRPY